jgi:hypothetical protein
MRLKQELAACDERIRSLHRKKAASIIGGVTVSVVSGGIAGIRAFLSSIAKLIICVTGGAALGALLVAVFDSNADVAPGIVGGLIVGLIIGLIWISRRRRAVNSISVDTSAIDAEIRKLRLERQNTEAEIARKLEVTR